MVQRVWVLHSVTNAQPLPERRLVAHRQLLAVYGWSVTFCGMEYPFAHFGSAVLAVLPHWQSVGR